MKLTTFCPASCFAPARAPATLVWFVLSSSELANLAGALLERGGRKKKPSATAALSGVEGDLLFKISSFLKKEKKKKGVVRLFYS